MPNATQAPIPWALVAYGVMVVILVAAMLILAYVIGERHRERATGMPYESGMVPTGSARVRFPAEFYLIAMFFVIFDLEMVFIVAWAVAVRQIGWVGYFSVVIFIGALLVSLGYLWRVGALDFGPGQGRLGMPEQKGVEEHADFR
ncbi:MAG: NADH-quinone oxidoreductase subunit A [Armatimonadota bacterium]